MAAGTSIFTLMGSVLVDNTKANESISKTESKAESLAGKFMKGVGVAAKWGAAIGGAAIAGGTALFGMANKAADTTDRIDKLSQKIGISRTAFQEYEYILGQNGANIEVMQRGMKTLGDRMDESTRGTGKGAEAFDRLKLSATDLNGELKSQEQMFEESAKALMAMPEGAEKSALAFDLFGKAGQELMPLLNGNAESFDELREKAHEMGLVLSDEAVDAGVLFTDSLDDVKRSLGAVVANIGVEVMPMFQKLMDWVMDHMPEIKEIMGNVFNAIGIFVNVVVDIFKQYLIPAFQSIYDWVKNNWPTIQSVIEGVFKAIQLAWDYVLKPVLAILWETFKVIVDWVSKFFKGVSEAFEIVSTAIQSAWDNVLEPTLTFLWDMFKDVVAWVQENWSKISDAFGAMRDAIVEIWGNLIEWVTTKWNELIEWITGLKDKFFTAATIVYTFLWDGLKNVWTTLLEWIDTVWHALIAWITDLKDKFKTAATTVFTFLWDGLKNVWALLLTWIDTVWNALIEWITDLKDKFKTAATTVFTFLWDGLKNVWDLLLSWIDTVWNALVTTVTDFKDKFKTAGKTIITDLLDGFKEAWTNVTTWVTDKLEWLSTQFQKAKDWVKQITDTNAKNPPTSSNPNSKANQIAARLGGSFAKGLDYVPYNGFIGELHEGERVLTKEENKEYNQGLRGGSKIEQTVNIYSPKAMSPSEVARENKKALQRLALQFPS